jgi:acetoacetate decarboxylase
MGNEPARGPYRFVNREYFIVTYETDMDSLRRVIPEPLEPISNQVLCTLAVFLFFILFFICNLSF